MDNRAIDTLLKEETQMIEGQLGYWRVLLHDREVLVVTDEGHDRMRIMTPIAEAASLPSSRLRVLLEANFDRALDAKYALGQGYLWSVFMHPLQAISTDFFSDALEQVVTLAHTYGGSYTSSSLVFGSPLSEEMN